MTMVQEDVVPAYAHCQSAQCLGYKQERVEGVRTVTSWTYLDKGGDFPGVESSTEMIRFANEDDAVCPQCDGTRAISEQLRPEYANISGHDPLGIFKYKGQTDGAIKDLQHARELDELRRDQEMKELREQVAALTQALSEKRGPGRPRKQPEDD